MSNFAIFIMSFVHVPLLIKDNAWTLQTPDDELEPGWASGQCPRQGRPDNRVLRVASQSRTNRIGGQRPTAGAILVSR